MVRGYDPDKHQVQVEKGVTDLETLIKNQDAKIEKAKKVAGEKAAAKTKADDKVTELTDERALLQGRLDQAKSVLARITGADKDADDTTVAEDQEALPV